MVEHYYLRCSDFVRFAMILLALVAGMFAADLLIASPPKSNDLPRLANTQITDLAGHVYTLDEQTADRNFTVLVFLGTECPVANGYLPALQRLYDKYSQQNVQILGVHCDPDVSAAGATQHAKEFGIRFPLVLDHQQRLAAACGARTMATAVVIRTDGQVIYRGRIDNRYSLTGARRPEATAFDLHSAIDAALSGQMPDVATTEVFGCPLPPPKP